MATNEILPFASTDTGTNLLTQAEYSADAQRTTGNQPGIARSKLVNKSLRQTSLLAAGLAQFLANKQSTNVTDNLTTSQIADMLVEAIKADYLRRDGTNAMTARLRGKMGAPVANNTNNAGIVFDGDEDSGLFSSGDGNLQLAIQGFAQLLFNAGQAIKSSKQIRVPAGAPNNQNGSDAAGFAFAESGDTGLFWEGSPDGSSGGRLRFRMDGGVVGEWYGGMTSFGTSGWVRTSEGLLIQWCQTDFNNGGGVGSMVGFGRTWPIGFPGGCLGVVACPTQWLSADDSTEHILAIQWDWAGCSGTAKRVYGSPSGDSVRVQLISVGF